MRKLLLLPILVMLVTFTSCKDDEAEPFVETPLDLELKGNWENFETVAVFIDGQDKVAHTDTSRAVVKHSFNKPNMKMVHSVSGQEATVNYALPDSSGTRYIVISDSQNNQDVFEIKSLTATDMVWEKVVRYASYKKDDTYITSRRGTWTYKFRKVE
ncbi:hypothetical protein FVR03_05850 [Pontibacter qinzhouensis]|uniref:DUF5004 domain-containing protein n=1 Tax=Pontibacter qinzhouensis TaxID=2603253 RepID=A0A5C8KC33_9BACT|nr:hypothetical protein [Pontibacter qinzhouensis]TXK49843.1 hypothetical protein FVR03_05850 [Pontibacter qinzhouensis]